MANMIEKKTILPHVAYGQIVVNLGKGPKIKKLESMVFDHRGGGGGHPKPNPYSGQFL